jgi:hypothetical protein
MSHHILHQFDEQWITENRPPDSAHTVINGREARRDLTGHTSYTTRHGWQRLLLTAALLLAAFALLFALDARHRADDLQHRLTVIERQK